jgi:hypothetical protein
VMDSGWLLALFGMARLALIGKCDEVFVEMDRHILDDGMICSWYMMTTLVHTSF